MITPELYVLFVGNLESSAVISRNGNTLDVMQKGTAHYGLLSFPFQTVPPSLTV